MSAHYRIEFQSSNNEDLRQGFALSDSESAPVDLTGASLAMRIEAMSGGTLVEASTANGHITLTDAANGRFQIAIPAAVMRTVPAGAYRHDLVLAQGGTVSRIWLGTLDLAQGVTP